MLLFSHNENLPEQPRRELYCLSMGTSGLSSYPLPQSGEKVLSSSDQGLWPQEPTESANHACETSPLVLHEFLLCENPTESPAFSTKPRKKKNIKNTIS